METSIFIAKLMGPYFLVAGVGMALNASGFRDVMKAFLKNDATIYLAGVLALALGLAIVNVHNRWALEWPLIITVFGWLSILSGIMRMTFPKLVAKIGSGIFESRAVMTVGGVSAIVLGAILSFLGYGA
jgi:hypothetical protein